MDIQEARKLLKVQFSGPEVLEALRFRLKTHLHDPTLDPLSKQVWHAYLGLPPHLEEPFSILDAGCMSGFLYHHLKKFFKDFEYTGVDRWPEALQVGREFGIRNLIEGDFVTGRFGMFDYIVCSNIPWVNQEQLKTAIVNLQSQARRKLFMIHPHSEIVVFEGTTGSTGSTGETQANLPD